jgi:phospholipase C
VRIASGSKLLAFTLFTVASFVGWEGCSPKTATGIMPAATAEGSWAHHREHRRTSSASAITHIFVIIQENRSLNNLFAADATVASAANTTMTGEEENSSGGEVPIALHPAPLATSPDIDHCYYDAAVAENGSAKPMDGFNNELRGNVCGPTYSSDTLAGSRPYSYVPQSTALQPYWDLANTWVLASNYYPTELGPSFVAHLNLIAGTDEYEASPATAVADYPKDGFPWGCPDKTNNTVRWLTATATPNPYTGPVPCYTQFHTIADDLDCIYCKTTGSYGSEVAVPWKFYTVQTSSGPGIWSAFQAIKRVYHNGSGGDWNNIETPPPKVLSDIPNGNDDTTGVVWITPEVTFSDHAAGTKDCGPSWVGNIVNLIGARAKLWNHSVIVVLWDDWGGWYDPAAPPSLDFRGFGIRTPMLIISPYAKTTQTSGSVSTELFSSGSILKFMEQTFDMPKLGSLPCGGSYSYVCNAGYTDYATGFTPTHSIGDVLNLNQSPRTYTAISVKYGVNAFKKGGQCLPANSAYGSGYYGGGIAPDDE